MEAVTRSRVIDASPEAIFDVLADPRRHAEIDGSGTVVEAKVDGPDRLEMGSKFGMKMKWGAPYRITNTVVEYDENKLIAWCHPGGHRWRYELEPNEEGTLVTETFDWSTSIAPWFIEIAGYPKKHPANMEATLERLDQVAMADAEDGPEDD